jgi:hypothetical protein
MTKTNKAPPEQTSMFDAFEASAFEQATAHLPSDLKAALPYFRALLTHFNAAVLAGDGAAVELLEQEADNLAIRLNGNSRFGMKADEDSPCNVLERETAASVDESPIWGQAGQLVVTVNGCRIRAEVSGIYGIGFPAFLAHVIDRAKPFISHTGYRSFLGYTQHFKAGNTLQEFVRQTLEDYVASDLRGKLVPVDVAYGIEP